jgi:hypothetical protein
LYPVRWRERYGGELEQLVRDLRSSRSSTWIAADLVKGAIGAHFHSGLGVRAWNWRVIRRTGLIAGAVWLVISVELFLSNVVVPATGDDTIAIIGSYLFVFGALFYIGRLAARSGAARRVQVFAGAAAGVLIGVLTIGSFAVIDNVWLSIVSRQPQKIDGFARSGAASMRAYLNHGLIGPAVFAVIVFGVTGAALGAFGGMVGDHSGVSAATTPARRVDR